MKEGWERVEQPILLELKQINKIIRPAFPGKQVMAAERIGTGFSNFNYKIHVEGSADPFVLRLFRQDAETADKELAISQLVHQTVPVADFIYADTSCDTFNLPWAVLEWKEGILLSEIMKSGSHQDISSAAAAIGRTLADIHMYSFPIAGLLGKDLEVQPIDMGLELYLSYMEQSLFHQPCGRWLNSEDRQAVWSFSQTYSSLLTENKELPVLVHSDFNGLNILMQSSLKGFDVSAVLDWEFAFSASRYIDIANMLRYEEDGSIFEKHFISSYQEQGGNLDPNWRILSKLEDLIALCDMLNRSTEDTPNRVRDLQHLIGQSVRI